MTPRDWLQKFGTALERGDINAAAGLFEPDGFWRDLVAFTWNIKTCEGRAEIKAMLAATLAEVKPRNFVAKTDEWFTFETALGRGIGHLRLARQACLDAAHHPAGAERLRRAARDQRAPVRRKRRTC